jgi:hypothetical protein
MARDSSEIIRLCAAAIEEGILALVEMGDTDATIRCKSALVALLGGDLGREYADYALRNAYQLVALRKQEFARALEQIASLENEIAQGFSDEMQSVEGVDDFLDACTDD